ncbi:unnamed protein product [Heligmosomoides polygyrus]|uniref:Uncharacterized protein n=1 Tax=Heligmosomoides polygyrus TaxID=6339 RepID=A0A183G834_HELPZ|nr:unnamed protein product [Heligmosomoides polygyrus]
MNQLELSLRTNDEALLRRILFWLFRSRRKIGSRAQVVARRRSFEKTRARVLREIWEASTDGTSAASNSPAKKHYISKKLSEFNNTVRLLEAKKEEALWSENYEKTAGIEVCLKKFRARERPFQELLRERMEAVSKNDFKEAQRAKSLYERTMEEVLRDNDFKKYLSKEEVNELPF